MREEPENEPLETHTFETRRENWFKPRCDVCQRFEEDPIHVEAKTPTFIEELTRLINYHSLEGNSDTPDFILAQYMQMSLSAFEATVRIRDDWFQDQYKKADPDLSLPTLLD